VLDGRYIKDLETDPEGVARKLDIKLSGNALRDFKSAIKISSEEDFLKIADLGLSIAIIGVGVLIATGIYIYVGPDPHPDPGPSPGPGPSPDPDPDPDPDDGRFIIERSETRKHGITHIILDESGIIKY